MLEVFFLACELLKDELIWCIGDGKTIKIWGDKWLPTSSTYAVQIPRTILAEDAKVKEFINQDSKWWNVSLI